MLTGAPGTATYGHTVYGDPDTSMYTGADENDATPSAASTMTPYCAYRCSNDRRSVVKGAFLVSRSIELFDDVRRALVDMGGTYYPEDGAVQLRDELGNLFTVYENEKPSCEYREGPLAGASGIEFPDLHDMVGVAVECRNERVFATLVKAIARASDRAMWVVDGDGVVWSALEVDAAKVRL